VDHFNGGLSGIGGATDQAKFANTLLAPRIRGQTRLNPLELHFLEPEAISLHPRLLLEAVNHNEIRKSKTSWVRALRTRPPLVELDIVAQQVAQMTSKLSVVLDLQPALVMGRDIDENGRI